MAGRVAVIERPAVTVGIASLCEASMIARTLEALGAQAGAPPFDVVVAHKPGLAGLDGLRTAFPHVQFVSRDGVEAPIHLQALAAEHATGELFVLTEDHCVPDAEWVGRLAKALQPGRAAVGGPIEWPEGASAVAWAFYFLDFYRYVGPLRDGPSATLSVCNVAYRRDDLEAIRGCWQDGFHETEVHKSLVERHGPLWAVPDARVRMSRRVGFSGAVKECYGQGRLFASKRVEFADTRQRLSYVVFGLTLPVVLFLRRAQVAFKRPDTRRRFLGALAPMTAMVLAWSWGEWLGYLTGRPARRLELAPEV
jgi:hypothetical protein